MNDRYRLIGRVPATALEPFDSMLSFDDALESELSPSIELDNSEVSDDGKELIIYASAGDDGESVVALRSAITRLTNALESVKVTAESTR